MKSLIILGASGHGKVVADTARLTGWSDIVFVDDAWPDCTQNGPWAVVGDSGTLARRREEGAAVFVAIGNNTTRERAYRSNDLSDSPVLVHPSAIVSPHSRLGAGTLMAAGTILNIASETGEGVILNTGCTIDHDCLIGDFAHISPGAHLAGNVTVGNRSWIGIGSSVRQGITIGADVTVGAGAAVVSDIADGLTVVGVPARILTR